MPKTSKKTTNQTLAKGLIHGTRDVIAQTDPLWAVILKKLQRLNRVYGFSKIETPIIEATMRARLVNGASNQANAYLTTKMLG